MDQTIGILEGRTKDYQEQINRKPRVQGFAGTEKTLSSASIGLDQSYVDVGQGSVAVANEFNALKPRRLRVRVRRAGLYQIRILYSYETDTERVFMVGGDQPPREIYRLPLEQSDRSAHLDVTGPGKDDWIFSLRWRRGTDSTDQGLVVRHGNDPSQDWDAQGGFELELMQFRGFGFWSSLEQPYGLSSATYATSSGHQVSEQLGVFGNENCFSALGGGTTIRNEYCESYPLVGNQQAHSTQESISEGFTSLNSDAHLYTGTNRRRTFTYENEEWTRLHQGPGQLEPPSAGSACSSEGVQATSEEIGPIKETEEGGGREVRLDTQAPAWWAYQGAINKRDGYNTIDELYRDDTRSSVSSTFTQTWTRRCSSFDTGLRIAVRLSNYQFTPGSNSQIPDGYDELPSYSYGNTIQLSPEFSYSNSGSAQTTDATTSPDTFDVNIDKAEPIRWSSGWTIYRTYSFSGSQQGIVGIDGRSPFFYSADVESAVILRSPSGVERVFDGAQTGTVNVTDEFLQDEWKIHTANLKSGENFNDQFTQESKYTVTTRKNLLGATVTTSAILTTEEDYDVKALLVPDEGTSPQIHDRRFVVT